ncbi:helix-turn-helix transcriptional regulator [Leucobacter sp. W1153]|uniref:helix-turn-helix transcriptional regulator n=1 Tax=Leucobacter sp. W1153 TaxID=3439064 RepID=UPI003F3B28DE
MTATTVRVLSQYRSPEDIAEMIPGMTTAKLAQLRFRGEGPRYYKPTQKTVVYDVDDVAAWMESTARTGTAEAVC